MKRSWCKLMMFVALLMLCNESCTRVSTPKFEKNLDALLEQSDLAIVHFINYDAIPEDKDEAEDMMEDLQDMKEDFIELSDDRDFQGVRFIGVDLKAFPDLVEEYSISEVSTIILFKDGKPFKRRGEIVQKVGVFDGDQIEDFIEEYFEDYVQQLQRRAQQAAQGSNSANTTTRTVTYRPYERRYYYRPYYNRTWYRRPYWRHGYYRRYGGRPYYWRHRRFARPYRYGYGRYGRRGGFGFGFGFGGRRGYGGFGLGW